MKPSSPKNQNVIHLDQMRTNNQGVVDSLDRFKPKGLCANCKLHKATMIYTNSTMDMVHGSYAFWCECCILKMQIQHAEERAKALPELKIKLQNTNCEE